MPTKLDSLYADITFNADDFFNKSAKIMATLDSIQARFKSFSIGGILGGALLGVNAAIAGMAGITAYATAKFGELDTTLRRTAAHMRDFNQENRPELQRGVFDLSGRSTSSANELAKALDVLTSSGLSASMAVKMLEHAENIAAVSGMHASKAAQRLIDIQTGFGQVDVGPKKFGENMKDLADMVVGTASLVGSSEEQLLDAFTGRFMSAARIAKLSSEEAAMILGLYSKMGDSFRGSHGGNLAAQAIENIYKGAQTGDVNWRNMLGEGAYDKATGKLRNFIDVLESMKAKMSDPNNVKYLAELRIMDIGGNRAISAIEPLLNAIGGVKNLREEMARMADFAKKAADVVRGSLQNQMRILWNDANNAASVIGFHLAPALYLVTKPLMDMIHGFVMLNPALQNLIVMTGAFLLALIPLWFISKAIVATMIGWYTVMAAWVSYLAVATGLVWAFNVALVMARLSLGVFLITWALAAIGIHAAATALYSLATSGKMFEKVFWAAIDAFEFLVKVAFGFMDAVFNAMEFLVKAAVNGISTIIDAFKNLGTIAMSVAANIIAGALNILMAIASALVAYIVLSPLIVAAFAMLASVVLTAGLAIYQLIGVTLIGALTALKNAAIGTLGWIADKLKEINTEFGGVWKAISQTGMAALATLGEQIQTVAGFLWNFRQNMAVLARFFEEFGAKPLEDLINAFYKLAMIIGGNLNLIVGAIGRTIVEVLMAAWNTVWHFIGQGLSWVRDQWANMAIDMASIIRGLMSTILYNWNVLNKAMSRISTAYRHEFLISMQSEAAAGPARKWAAKERQEAMDEMFKDLKGPAEFTPKMLTNFGLLQTMMGAAALQSEISWKIAGLQAAKAFGQAFKGAKPLSDAFEDILASPMWQDLFHNLNFAVPTFKEGLDLIRNIISPTKPTDETGGAAGGHGPGFSLKQGSLSRFVYDGELNASIDYQQLVEMKLLNRNVQTLVDQGNRRGVPGAVAGDVIQPALGD